MVVPFGVAICAVTTPAKGCISGLAVRDALAAAGIAPLARDWPPEDLVLATRDGAGFALALVVLRGEQAIPRLR